MMTIKKYLNHDKNLTRLFAILIIVTILFTALKGSLFMSVANFQSMGKQFPEFGLLSIAMAMALFTGGIDLSLVYIATLSAVLVAKLLPVLVTEDMSAAHANVMILLCFAVAVGVGALCGAINGLLISGIGIPAILATLGTQSLFRGIAVVLTGGSTLSGFTPHMSGMINANVFGVPITVLIFLVCAIVIGFILSKTVLGYKLRMLGTNSKATSFCGMNNVSLYTVSYTLGGILAAVAGIIMIGRFNSAKADYGASYTMQSILIAVLGGVDPSGGKGNIQGVCIGVVIIQMVSSWLNMYENISNFYRQIIFGVLLILVLIMNHYLVLHERKKAMKKS
ncbi:MAG: ABC transporter permease [Lachnospiraceae bacterium]|nr:ABC transporter permease [Lachnospiraceae bacterium]MDY5741830.1 ABC transporter permease [Lachnospiraceae bacterium]